MGNESKKVNEIRKIEWDFYQNHRAYLRQLKHEQENKFSQNIIYLGAGSFSLLATFSQIFKVMDYKIILTSALAFSWISLILMLISFRLSVTVFNESIRLWDKTRTDLPEDNCCKIFMNFSSLTSFIFLLISLLLIFIFYTLNFLNMSDSQKIDWIEKGGFQKNSEPVSSWIPPTEFFQSEQWASSQQAQK